MTRTLFALSQHATACDNKLQVAVRNDMRDSSYVLQSTPPYYSVLQSVLRTTKCYSSTTLYYKVQLLYYSVLRSTTPVLLCTTKCYSSTALHYKVLLQYYSVLQSTTLYYKVLLQYSSVLQSTTPVLVCTTKCYSSTTLYYKVLLQYYSVLQSTTPVLVCTTKYYSSTSLYYKVLLHAVLVCTTKYQNVLRDRQFFNILTWKCASRHSGVQFLNIGTSKSGPKLTCFVHFHLPMCTAACNFWTSQLQKVLRTPQFFCILP